MLCCPSLYANIYLPDSIDSNQEEAKYERYLSSDQRFSILFPDHWELIYQNNYSLAALSPIEGAHDIFRENVLVGSFRLTSSKTLWDYFMGNLLFLKKKVPGLQLISSELIKVNGEDAVQLIYISKNQDSYYRTMQIFMVKDSRGYIITFMAEEEAFKKYSPVFNQVYESFKFQ